MGGRGLGPSCTSKLFWALFAWPRKGPTPAAGCVGVEMAKRCAQLCDHGAAVVQAGALTPPGPCDQPHPKRCLSTPLYPGKESFGWMCLQMPLEFCWASKFTCTLLDLNAAFRHESCRLLPRTHCSSHDLAACLARSIHWQSPAPCYIVHTGYVQ